MQAEHRMLCQSGAASFTSTHHRCFLLRALPVRRHCGVCVEPSHTEGCTRLQEVDAGGIGTFLRAVQAQLHT